MKMLVQLDLFFVQKHKDKFEYKHRNLFFEINYFSALIVTYVLTIVSQDNMKTFLFERIGSVVWQP